MMGNKPGINHIVELDGLFYHLNGKTITLVEELRRVKGDKWLVTDFQEGMARLMTVEGPAKYADLLVRRKLQESGEFEEPVKILTHWKKKSGKSTTDVFFTAVPTRLARIYLDELRGEDDITLVFPMYAVLWHHIKRSRSEKPVAVVLRHGRFAEVLVGSRDRVICAERCVAFDTAPEQIDALWNTVRSVIELVENERKAEVGTIFCLNWLNAGDVPKWPDDWRDRLVTVDQTEMQGDEQKIAVSWPIGVKKQSVSQSVSYPAEKFFYYTKRWVPAFNVSLILLAAILAAGMMRFQQSAERFRGGLLETQRQIDQVRLNVPEYSVVNGFDELLKFVVRLDHNRKMPSYQQVVDDLTQGAPGILALKYLKLDFNAQEVRLELSGDIQAPFEQAHGGYRQLLKKLELLGYAVAESRFETQINTSQVHLKLIRPEI